MQEQKPSIFGGFKNDDVVVVVVVVLLGSRVGCFAGVQAR